MEQENLKKYKIMENVLNKINQKYISIPENVMKQNRHIMEEVCINYANYLNLRALIERLICALLACLTNNSTNNNTIIV